MAKPMGSEEGGSASGLPSLPTSGSGGAGAGGTAGGKPSQVAGQAGASGGKSSSSGGQVATGGEGGSGAELGDVPSTDEIMDEYRDWQPQTPEPVAISAYIFGLCRLPTLAEMEFSESVHGDERYLQDWANPEAQAGIARRGVPAFEKGSVIVKEKYVQTGSGPELVAIAMMIKRETGFEPAQGDWDYAYYEPQLGTIQTEEQSAYCSGCHAGAKGTDFVFVDGLKPGG